MDQNVIEKLANLSFLNFSDDEARKIGEELGVVIKSFEGLSLADAEYDAFKDNCGVYLKDLREDTSAPSMPNAELLKNALNIEDSFVVPKVMDS